MRNIGKSFPVKEQRAFSLVGGIYAAILILFMGNAMANPQLNLDNPAEFFTTVASNFLSEQLAVDISHIRIYPTNDYTPAVHRLLQVTANMYDATTTNFYPTVFRPYFTSDGTNVFISGYEQVNTNSIAFDQHPIEIADAFSGGMIGTNAHLNFYNIPWMLGVKKGLPNFNEVSMENIASISRRLQFVHQSATNELDLRITPMYELGISNVLGLEFWNSYASNYPGTVLLNIDCLVTATVTNGQGLAYSNAFTLTSSLQTNRWLGYNPNFPKTSFIVVSNFELILPDSVYHENPPHFESTASAGFDAQASFSLPDWKMSIQSKIYCEMFDAGPPLRLLDYVQLDGPVSARDLTAEIRTPDGTVGAGGYWSTNLVDSGFGIVPQGVENQILVNLGELPLPPGSDPNLKIQINAFLDWVLNFHGSVGDSNQAPIVSLSQTPQLFIWEANDPLIHYTSSDIIRVPFAPKPPFSSFSLISLGAVNHSYLPWGSFWQTFPDAFNFRVKDPSVRSSDNWNFPSGQTLDFSWLSRVHRGTPWQTIYLKSAAASLAEWESFSGITNPVQAALTHPTNDWAIAALWARWLNTNELTTLLSINSGADAWSARLDGLTVLTNTSGTQYDSLLISSNSPQTATVVAGIQTARAAMPGQFFRSVGDVMSIPELSFKSPWLNHAYDQSPYGISDEAFEKIATQLLPLFA